MIQISLSKKTPSQGVLEKSNFHSTLCVDRKQNMFSSFHNWLIHLAVVLKVFVLSLWVLVSHFMLQIPFVHEWNPLQSYFYIASSELLKSQRKWRLLCMFYVLTYQPCTTGGQQSLLRLLWKVQISVYEILVAYSLLEV